MAVCGGGILAHRTFTDRHGRVWEVWDVHPALVERRAVRQVASVVFERRQRNEPRVHLPDALREGWLAFESGRERRRLMPIPPAWDERTDTGLSELLDRATSRSRIRRLIE